MTCIVGLKNAENVYIGADSAGVSGFDLIIRADAKVFYNGAFLIGFTTSFRMGQLLRYSFQPPVYHPDDDLFRFMATDFVNGVRQCLRDGGFAQKSNEQESGGAFLVGYRGRLFVIESDYQVGEHADDFAAIGCGAQVAFGSLYSTVGQDAQARLLKALEAAEHFSAGVRGPFAILEGIK